MDLHAVACEELLGKMAVPSYKNTFALGLFAKRVTVRSQQVRALNLIHSLVATGRITANSNVLVIGAGFAGVTAAAAAVRAKCVVTVLERTQSRLSLQRNCRHRFLHPNFYDWPRPGSLSPDAGLPVLNWRAALAETVVREIDGQVDKLASSGLKEVFGIESVVVLPTGEAIWKQDIANIRNPFDAIILAVGFGVEKEDSYWADIPIDMNTPREPDMKVLVSGSGDGALTDLMRVCILNFRHDEVLGQFASAPGIHRMNERIIEIENSLQSGDAEFLSRSYEDPSLDLGVRLGRRKWRVYWAPGSANMFTPNSSALNRFIVSQLFHSGAFHPLVMHGRTEKVEPLAPGGFNVTFSTGYSEDFDIVVRRHGPLSSLAKDFPSLANACSPLEQGWKSFDPDWTSRILLEDENTSRSSHRTFTPAPDSLYTEDLSSVRKFGYKIGKVANRETVIVVVGTGLWQELLDRPAAQIVQAAVNAAGHARFRRAIILAHASWDITSEVHTNPVISVGGPNSNQLTRELEGDNRYEMEPGVFGSWTLHLGMPRAALWGTDAPGTLRAVENYIRRPEGLQAFLRQSWK